MRLAVRVWKRRGRGRGGRRMLEPAHLISLSTTLVVQQYPFHGQNKAPGNKSLGGMGQGQRVLAPAWGGWRGGLSAGGVGGAPAPRPRPFSLLDCSGSSGSLLLSLRVRGRVANGLSVRRVGAVRLSRLPPCA